MNRRRFLQAAFSAPLAAPVIAAAMKEKANADAFEVPAPSVTLRGKKFVVHPYAMTTRAIPPSCFFVHFTE